jgi:hypothetical protein
MTILRTALQRDPTRRYASAAAMGEACEHFLYDKGYGPTNLTLKKCLAELFPEARPEPLDEAFPELEAELLPIDDGLPEDDAVRTAVRPVPAGLELPKTVPPDRVV